MRQPEIAASHPESYGPLETDPGPPPVTTEELRELLDYLQFMRAARSDAIRDRSIQSDPRKHEELEAVLAGMSKELVRTYSELGKLQAFLRHENVGWHITDPAVLATAHEELSFAAMASRILRVRSGE